MKTDLDLAPAQRTQANYYRAQDFQARAELRKANKGLRRLRKRLDKVDRNAVEQNKRMREWFKERTGIDDILLRAHMDKIDDMIDELKDFAIWLTGCGYDFTQHDYFIKQRDKLLKGK